jgi:hypothetical protein
MARRRVAMIMLHLATPRDRRARDELAAALGDDATVGEPDDVGAFAIEIEADDFEQALARVWNAVAASAVDDHIAFLEHPDIPEHWRHRTSPARV